MSGSQNCGFTSRQQCELTRAGNGGFCVFRKSLLPAVSTAADVCAAYPAMTIFARPEMLTAERP